MSEKDNEGVDEVEPPSDTNEELTIKDEELQLPDADSSAPDMPPPTMDQGEAKTSQDIGRDDSSALPNFITGAKKKFVALGAVIALILGVVVVLFGSSSGNSKVAGVEYFAIDAEGAVYLANLKDEQLVVSTRINEDPRKIVYYESLSSSSQQELVVVAVNNNFYVWDDEDSNGAESVLSFDKKAGTSEIIYSGKDIAEVMFIADKQTFIVNDGSNCFGVPIGKVSTRIASNNCAIVGGRIFSRESKSNGTSLMEVDSSGSSLGSFQVSIENSFQFHKNGGLVSGYTEAGTFVVYSTSDGKRMFESKENERFNVLDTARSADKFLVSREDLDAYDETLEVGVMSIADGSAVLNVVTSPYSSSGWISPDGASALIFSKETQDSETLDLTLWSVADKTSTDVVPGIRNVIITAEDREGRFTVITDRELIAGTFETGFATRALGDFSGGYVYSSPSGSFVILDSGDYDLFFVEDGVVNDASNRTLTLATGLDSVTLSDSSLAVDGFVYYSSESNDYTDIYRQKLEKDSVAVKVAEGRIDGFQVDPKGSLFYYERESDRIIASYIQKNEKPESRSKISDRNIYLPFSVKLNPNNLEFRRSYLDTFTAFVDEDFKTCRSRNLSILKSGDSENFSLTRVNNNSSELDVSDYKLFCVRNASEIVITNAARLDGNVTSVWAGIFCRDADLYGDDSSRGRVGDSVLSLTVRDDTGYICAVYDWSDYARDFSYDTYEFTDPVRGMNVTIEVR